MERRLVFAFLALLVCCCRAGFSAPASGSLPNFEIQSGVRDPGVWGLALVDIARHAANGYAGQGEDPQKALARIRQLFDAEWNAPTDTPQDITGE
jgi:hypothetical protein